jgi:guanylate kinase
VRPILLLLMGPTGVGKSTIVRHLEALDGRFRYIRPYTTRELRDGESDKVFVTEIEMEHLWREGALLVVNSLYGIKYGTPRFPIEEAFKVGHFPVIDWPIQQIEVMNNAYPGQLFRVYVKPPDLATLKKRLSERSDFDLRVEVAQRELESLEKDDYRSNIDVIVNNETGLSTETAVNIYQEYTARYTSC